MSCADPIGFEALVAYWLDELQSADAQTLEQHLFGCGQCAGRLEWIAALADGVRAVVRAGALGMVVSAPFVEAMKRAGLRLREYQLEPGASVNCTIRSDEDAVVSRVRATLSGVERVDVLHRVTIGGVEQPEVRVEDVPFDPATGEILLIPPAAALKAMPAHIVRTRLVAVREAGEAPIGDYTFMHSAQ